MRWEGEMESEPGEDEENRGWRASGGDSESFVERACTA